MTESLTEVQREMRTVCRRFLADHAPAALVREADGFDRTLWSRLVHELGVTALRAPEEVGGHGAGVLDMALFFEEAGRALAPVPLLASVGMATVTLVHVGPEAHPWLARLLAGEETWSAVLGDDGSALSDSEAHLEASRAGSSWHLRGDAPLVLDGDVAERLLVPARLDTGHELGLFVVSGHSATRRSGLDLTRRLARVSFDGAEVEPLTVGPTRPARLRAAIREARVYAAAEMIGAGQWAIDTAVNYASTRVQFGQPIGAFQAVKHLLVSRAVELRSARATVHAAASALDSDEEADLLVRSGVVAAARAAVQATGDAIQVLGGIGFTWEHDAHLYLRRAMSDRAIFDAEAVRASLLAPFGLKGYGRTAPDSVRPAS